MKKRIALISYHTCPLSAQEGKETGGMNVYVRELAKELVQKGYIIDVFTRSQDENSERVVNIVQNGRVIHIAAGPRQTLPRTKLFPYIEEFVKKIYEFIQNEGLEYDIIDCHYYLSGIAGEQLQQLLPNNPPLYMTFHRIALMKNLLVDAESKEAMQTRIEAEKRLSQKAFRIITPSSIDSCYIQYLYDCPKEKIAIITPGVDTDIFYPMDKSAAKQKIGAKKDEKIILFVARIEPDKGIDTLMYAFKMFIAKKPQEDFSLWIVGGDTSKPVNEQQMALQKLEILKDILGLHDSVRFIPGKDSDELAYYYNAADFVVLPSYYESFGMIALEAMACATPVIVTDTSGIAEIVTKVNKNLVISANNPRVLASVMYMLEQDDRCTTIGKQLFEEAIQHDWRHIAHKISGIYENILHFSTR